MHHRARAEEEHRLEEGVRHEMEHRGGERADPDREHHVAELTDGRVGKHCLEPPLCHGDNRRKERRKCPEPCDEVHHEWTLTEDEEGTRNEEYTCRDHRRRMDERRGRRRAFHRIEQPDVERELSGLSDRSHEEQQTDHRQVARPRDEDILGHHEPQLDEVHRPERNLYEQDADQHSKVADARRDERLLRRLARRDLIIVESDQEVGAEPDALPEHIELEKVDRDDQPEHRGRKQRDERKEAPHPLIVLHITDGVDVDEQRDQRHDDEHECRQRVDQDAHRELHRTDVRPDRLHHVGIAHRDLIVHRSECDKDGERKSQSHHHNRNRRREVLLPPRKGRDNEERERREQGNQIRMCQSKGKHSTPLP